MGRAEGDVRVGHGQGEPVRVRPVRGLVAAHLGLELLADRHSHVKATVLHRTVLLVVHNAIAIVVAAVLLDALKCDRLVFSA